MRLQPLHTPSGPYLVPKPRMLAGRLANGGWRIHCPRNGCQFCASALTEGRAINALGNHLVQVHVQGAQ